MSKEPATTANVGTKIEYKRVKTILELDSKIFHPCEIKEFEKGVLRKQIYFVHFNGKKWDILRISNNKIERYILE